MSGFSADWLTLREPYDRSARNGQVLAQAAAALAGFPSVTIVDLACGTGATRRAVAAQFPPRQHWRLVDNDLGLLARAGAVQVPAGQSVTTIPIDLAYDFERALDGAVDLVTTSALLDLVSAEWLERLVIEVAARRLPFYAALTYDGEAAFDPADPRDADVVAAVNRDQLRDKGFGPALGPRAAATLIERCRAVGYTVSHGRSDWRLGRADRQMQTAVMTGWAVAVRGADAIAPDTLADWLQRRGDLVQAGRSAMLVGHLDVFARPTGTR